MTVTRIAPSPSGWLHVGNAVNFLLTEWAAGSEGRIRLRIDDLGLAVADRHLADIFWAVGWLGIPLAGGPRDAADFVAHHRQGARLDRYRSAGGALGPEWVYACSCSRTDVARRPVTTPDPCRDLALPLEPGHTALRFRTADGPPPGPATANALAALGLTRAGIAAEMGDFVVWRRDDLPAYQLVSMIDDTDQGVELIVRGHDLLPSSGAQLLLAAAMGTESLAGVRFVHHDLVTDVRGHKLSKRDDADALHAVAATPDGRDRVHRLAVNAAVGVGITPVGQYR